MRIAHLFVVLLPLALSGCLSFSSSDPAPPRSTTTIVVPSGPAVVCSNGGTPPC